MVRPDLIVTWPKHIDYPPFRMFLQIYWPFFDEIIIVFTDHHIEGWDFATEIAKSLDNVTILFAKGKGKDWRDEAVNLGLTRSDSAWVLFIEQDFFIKDGETLKKMLKEAEHHDMVALKQEDRWHPAFMLVRKPMIEKTDRNFSAEPDRNLDHFGIFTKQLENKGAMMVSLSELGLESEKDFRHLNGLSYNITQCILGNEHLYDVENFKWYIDMASQNVEVSKKYKALEKICKYAISQGTGSKENKKD